MIAKSLKVVSLLLVLFFLMVTTLITAQDTAGQLVINQVSLNKNLPRKSWIEIFNPTDKDLILEKFRLSHIKTINVLPEEIRKEGGIKVAAGEYIILCADENKFKSDYGKHSSMFNVEALSMTTEGGFLAITTKGFNATKGSTVRYGKKNWSLKIANLAGSQVIGFSEEGKSYSRKIDEKGSKIEVLDFSETTVKLGNINN